MKSNNPMGMVQNLIKNNSNAQNMMAQLQKMTPEQQAQQVADYCNKNNIDINELKKMLGK